MKALRLLLSSMIGLLIATSAMAQGPLRVDVTEGVIDPVPIAIPDFLTSGEQRTEAGTTFELSRRIASVVAADLERSGLFRSVSKEAFIQQHSNFDALPNYRLWRAIGSELLLVGQLDAQLDGNIQVKFFLYDVVRESPAGAGVRYVLPPRNWRRAAHLISDVIYKRVTGESGYFDSRIVYISESGPKTSREKRLAIMDQDGANHRFLTDGRDLVLTPRFSPSQQEITYLAYYNEQPRVYLYNLESGKHEVLGDFPNMTFAPRFSPDGNSVIFSQAINGNSDIFVMDLRTRRIRRLTNDPGIDTSPSYSPDGRQVVFNSDRGGSQQIYVMNANGSGVKRISYGNGARYGTPVWSPRGDLVAFTRIGEGKFRIGVMRPDGSGERLLTDAYQDEGPTWSPNGRVLIFFRTERYRPDGSGGEAALWSVDLTGYNERRVPTPIEASDPAWSPLLQ